MTRRLAVLISVAVAVASCGRREVAPAVACLPQDGALGADATFDALAGEYGLTLVATGGDSADREVTGTLWLEPNDSAARQFAGPGGNADPTVSVPLYGWTDVAARDVGALELGDLLSRDPASPGVLVLEQRPQSTRPPSVTLRIGSLANRRDLTRFDGGYTALRVGWLDEAGGFGGSWASGVGSVEAEGHFCAAPAG